MIKNIKYYYDYKLSYKSRGELVKAFTTQFGVTKTTFYETIKKNIMDLPLNKIVFFADYITNGSIDRLLDGFKEDPKFKKNKTLKELLS